MKRLLLVGLVSFGLMGCDSLNKMLGFTDPTANEPVAQRQITGTLGSDKKVPLAALSPFYNIISVEVAPSTNPGNFAPVTWKKRMTGSSAGAGDIIIPGNPGDFYRITVNGPQL